MMFWIFANHLSAKQGPNALLSQIMRYLNSALDGESQRIMSGCCLPMLDKGTKYSGSDVFDDVGWDKVIRIKLLQSLPIVGECMI